MRLDASVAVHGQRVAMDLDRVAVDQNVALDQGQMDVESFGISRQCSCQITSGDVRQTAPSYCSRRPTTSILAGGEPNCLKYPRLSLVKPRGWEPSPMAVQRTARQRSSRLRSHCECMAAFGKGAGTVLRRPWAQISRRCDESSTSTPRPIPRLAAPELDVTISTRSTSDLSGLEAVHRPAHIGANAWCGPRA
jgi:hypothetical protein